MADAEPVHSADDGRSKAPEVCLYCDGEGNGSAGPCGFCVEGKPLDTQKDWDRSWGKVFAQIEANRADPSRTIKRYERRSTTALGAPMTERAMAEPTETAPSWQFAYERAVLDLHALADVIDVLLTKRCTRQADREFAQRRLARIRGRYPDPLQQFDGSGGADA